MAAVAPALGPNVPVGELFLQKLGIEPTPEQLPILRCRKRVILVAGGIQSGKSYTASNYLLVRIPESPAESRYGLVAADYNRTEREFNYLRDDLLKLGMLKPGGYSKRVDPGFMEMVDGTKIVTLSAKDPRTIAMYAYDGLLVCEASQVDIETFWKCQERVAAKKGWILLSGSFESSLGWYPSLFTEWRLGYGDCQSFSLPTWTNKALFPGGRNDPEILRLEHSPNMSPDFFMERFAAVPRPPHGLVFPEFSMEYHVKDVRFDAHYPVQIAVDPGYSHYAAVLAIQDVDGQNRVIDEVYEKKLITEDIIALAQGRPWWKKVTGGAIDVAAYQHQAMAAPAEIWLAKTGLRLRAEKVRVPDGTDRVKAALKIDPLERQPHLVVSPRCKGLLSEFGVAPNPDDGQVRAYRWKTDRDGNVVGDEPQDINNDAIKALTYWLVAEYGYVKREAPLSNQTQYLRPSARPSRVMVSA